MEIYLGSRLLDPTVSKAEYVHVMRENSGPCATTVTFFLHHLFKDIAADFESQSNKLAQKNSAVTLFFYFQTYIHTHSFSLALSLSHDHFLFLQQCQSLIKQARSFSTPWLYGYGLHDVPQA